MEAQEVQLSAVVFYAQERQYRRMHTCLLDLLRRFGSDPVLLFWRAFSIVLEDRLVEGIRELSSLQDNGDLLLCVPLALVYAHKHCQSVDREEVQKLEQQIRSRRSNCNKDKAMYLAATVLWLTGRHDKAREYAERLLKIVPDSAQGLTLRGWIDLSCNKEALMKKSIRFFDEAVTGLQAPPIGALLGKARYNTVRYKYSLALEVLNSALQVHPTFLPALIEKIAVQMAKQEWEAAVDTAHRCLSLDPACLEAIQMQALEQCTQRGQLDQAAHSLGQLIHQLDQSEPQSHHLYFSNAKCFCRMSGGHKLILDQTRTMVERAISIKPSRVEYILELAYEHLIGGGVQDAIQLYRQAFSLDESSMLAMGGVIHCQLILGQLQEAHQQLEFLNELQSSLGAKNSELLFLNALLDQKMGQSHKVVLSKLKEAVQAHFSLFKGYPLGVTYLQLLNPYFLECVAETMLVYAPSDPLTSLAAPQEGAAMLADVSFVLDPVSLNAPGLPSILLLLARVKFLSGERDVALKMLQKCIDVGYKESEALLLTARIHLTSGNTQLCLQTLESALSNNFEVQQYALYHLVKGQAELLQETAGQSDTAAVQSLQMALNLMRGEGRGKTKSAGFGLNLGEQVLVFVELARAHIQHHQQPQAAKVMQDAISQFVGTPEEARVTIANADMALAQGNVKDALDLLGRISEDKPYFIQAREKMANIFLNHVHDHQRYISCYRELASKLPGPPTELLLGDALMSVQEPEQALVVYERALKKNPNDSVLTSKVGQAHVRTHHYPRAINYYETALKSHTKDAGLRCELAQLYLKLSYFDKAEKTLLSGLDSSGGDQDERNVGQLMDQVQYCLLLATVSERKGQTIDTENHLLSAWEKQDRIVRRAGIERPDTLLQQRELAARILYQLAEQMSSAGKLEQAEQYCREALHHQEDSIKVRLLLAQVYVLQGALDQCEQECLAVLHSDPACESAAEMMADILFRKGEVEQASRLFEDILSRSPGNFEALARLLDLMRRAGQLSKCQRYLSQAGSHAAHSVYEPGLSYCQGLHHRYMGESEQALLCFNNARRDSTWGERAVFNMVEICLNPDNDTVGGETLKPVEETSGERLDWAIRTAEKLLRELHPQSANGQLRLAVLDKYVLLTTRSRPSQEKALIQLTEMASNTRESVPVLLALATTHVLLRQVPRARNHLKRVTKRLWNVQEAEEFERSWLLLADIYIQSGKHDLANDLLKRCLQYNQSCGKAWEYLGFISEKDQAYKDAANNYENAWRFSHFASPAVGYRLAFNYLKAHKYVEAVDVCHRVLAKHPSYPRIRKDIMDKARQGIRI